MYVKQILIALLTACGDHSSGATAESPDMAGVSTAPEHDGLDDPDDVPPPPDIQDDYIFCCHDVDPKTKSGEGCITIGEKQIDSCSAVLICTGDVVKKDGVTTCL